MHFYIVTPSLNQLDFLKRLVASVADQVDSQSEQQSAVSDQPSDPASDLSSTGLTAGCSPTSESESSIHVHHHVQDACSSDGTREFLAEHLANSEQLKANGDTFTYESEPDTGMYDALNKGIAFAGTRHQQSEAPCSLPHVSQTPRFFGAPCPGNDGIIAWLNCDEQYLPGTLEKVAAYFSENPDVDILTGDYLVVDEQGELMAYRKGYRLRKSYVEASHLYTLSCATFYRQRVFEQVGQFDTSFKAAADEEFILRALRAGYKARHMHSYLSAFTFSDQNLGASQMASNEHMQLKNRTPRYVRFLKPLINAVRLCEKWLSGAYCQKFPLTYSIYAGDAAARKEFVCQRTGWKWPTGGE